MDILVTDLTGSAEMRAVFGNEGGGHELYQKTYEPNQWERSDVLSPQIGIEDVLATQALVMRLLHERPRTVLSGEKRHGFALVNNIVQADREEFYDGSTEEYLACRVAKVNHDQWRMRIRFRENTFTEEQKTTSYIDDFSFDWLRSDNLQAWHGKYLLKKTPEGTYERWKDIMPISTEMLETLHSRIQRHVGEEVSARNE